MAWSGASSIFIKTYGKKKCTNCDKIFLLFSPTAKYCGRAILKTGCAYQKHLEKTRRAFHKHYKLHHNEYRKRMKVRRSGNFISKKIPKKIINRTWGLYKSSPEGRLKRKNSLNIRRGKDHPNWKGGVTAKHEIERKSLAYKEWRMEIFERDNYTCVLCGKRGGNLEADHIKPFAHYPKLRFVIDNGRTLCKSCHRKTDTWGYKSRLTRNGKK